MTSQTLHITFLDGQTINPGDLNWSPLEALGTFTVYDRTAPDEVLKRAEGADVLIVNKTRLTEAHFEALTPRLRLVCVAATGYDRIDTEAARRHDVTVCNCAGYSTHSVSQLTASLILEACDHVGDYALCNRMGVWSGVSPNFCYTLRPRLELNGRSLAVIGLGHIGRAVAEIMRPFGLKLYAVTSKAASDLPDGIAKITLAEAFSSCDIVSLNCPLTEDNRAFVNDELLATAKAGLILVNTARGGLIDEQAVVRALQSGRLGAYCADVLTHEPPAPDCPLLQAPRTILTPHIGWETPEARQRIMQLTADHIRAYCAGRPESVVNP